MILRVVRFSFILIAVTSCSSSKKTAEESSVSVSVKNPFIKEITVDGIDTDWPVADLNASPEKTFEYSVAHNDQFLFLRMRIKSPFEQRKFLSSGMELWIDPAGEKKQKTEIVFPVKGQLATNALQNNTGEEKQTPEMMHLNIRAQLTDMNRIGFKPAYSGFQTISQNTGFRAAINWNQENDLIYELKVPFEAFVSPVLKEKIDLEFSIGALERTNPSSSREGADNSGGFRQGGSMGGMRNGGGYRNGGGRGYGNTERRNQSSSTQKTDWSKLSGKETFWVETKL